MKKTFISLCLLLVSFTIQAQSLQGIRIESKEQSVIVYINEQPVCTPTSSCFVTNLNSGNYRVEVYSNRLPERPSLLEKRKYLLHSESVNYRGRGIHDIVLKKDYNSGKEQNDRRPHTDKGSHNKPSQERVMNEDSFETFLRTLKKESLSHTRLKMIENTLATTQYTSKQCEQIVRLYTFDMDKSKVMKLIYPHIVDKQEFFMVIDKLSSSFEKDRMYEFVKEYHEK